MTLLDDFTPHVRQVGARKSLADVDREVLPMLTSETTTGFYNLFPNSIFVLHPLWISQVMLEPKAADRVELLQYARPSGCKPAGPATRGWREVFSCSR